jgi:hypothetical protein
MKPLLAILAVAALCFAATESRVSRAAILAVERGINENFAGYSADPYDVLGTARGTYLEGYGTLFTTELDLINAGPISASPFKPVVTPQEIATTRERKMKKLVALKESMRTLMANASTTLEGLPPNEHVAMEAILFYYSWENSRGLPHRVFMSAEKQKLMEAKTAHADQQQLAAIIEEQER